MRLIVCAFILSLVTMLSGCGPIYKTEYNYVPPHSNMSKMCVAQCVQAKSHCEQLCELKNQNCVAQARQEAFYEYEIYKHDRKREGKKVKKDIGDFDRSYRCQSSCDCTPSFNTCYSACGGQVLEKQVCVAFCDKK